MDVLLRLLLGLFQLLPKALTAAELTSEDAREHWAIAARELGLRLHEDNFQMEGILGGFFVELRQETSLDVEHLHIEVEARLTPQYPRTVRALDRRLRPSLVQVVLPDIGTGPLLAHEDFVRLEEDVLLFSRSGPGAFQGADWVRGMVEAAEGLVAAIARYGHQLSARTGLPASPDFDTRLPQWTGTIDGIPVQMRHAPSADGLCILATLPISLPMPLTVWAKADTPCDEPDTVPLQDLILDAALHATTGDPDAARALLACDSVREDLLAVLKGHPGARIEDGIITIALPEVDLTRATTAVSDAARLARALMDQLEASL